MPRQGFDVDELVERMLAAAEKAIRAERGSLAHDPHRINGITVEFAVDPVRGVREVCCYVSRRPSSRGGRGNAED